MTGRCCLLIGLLALVLGLAWSGWTAAGTIYVYKDSRGVLHFTDLPNSKEYSPYRTCSEDDRDLESRQRILEYIQTYSRKHGVDPHLVQAIIQVESNFSPRARSAAGAEGLMQLMPKTQQDLGVYRPFDAQDNIRGGVAYLAQLLNQFPSLDLALAAYNAGPSQVQAYSGVPPFPETRRYVQKVQSLYQDLSVKTREYVQSGQ
ncbi:MAG: lytic transglycosylase domain-containing protein [Desulfovermiculus sp.]|nr:lytic transglycosylase domain-containing protein [Desulfovermiculus sp.]